MNLWVDDLRDPAVYGRVGNGHLEWVWARTVGEAAQYLLHNDVERASLDHDFEGQKYSGEDLINWMHRFNRWPSKGVALHSSNVRGLGRMSQMMVAWAPYPPTGLYQWSVPGGWSVPVVEDKTQKK